MFDAMAIELQGLVNRTRELLLEERSTLGKAIGRQEVQLPARRTELAEIDADRLRMQPEREAKMRRRTHQNVLSLAPTGQTVDHTHEKILIVSLFIRVSLGYLGEYLRAEWLCVLRDRPALRHGFADQ